MEQAPRWPGAGPGWRFAPKPRELILYYLNPRVAGQPPFGEPEGVMCAADVYSADPGTLTLRLHRFGHDDGNWYFLCVARWKDGNAGTRMSRAVQGGGTWHGSGKRMAVGRHGYRQTFEYRLPGGGGKSVWLMEEIGTSMPEATGADGVKVLCRVHRTPRATAADDGAASQERHETDEVVQSRPSKKPRCELRQEHDDFAAANCWALPPPTNVGCSYASTSQTTLVNAAAPKTTRRRRQQQQQQQQQPPMMEQCMASYHSTGVNGGVYAKDEEQPLEVLLPDEGWEQFGEIDYGFGYAAEEQMNNELMRNIFSCPNRSDAALQENDDPRGSVPPAS